MTKSEHRAAVKAYTALDSVRVFVDCAIYFVEPDEEIVCVDKGKLKQILQIVTKSMATLENYI
jgi:hypothetical protein